MAKLLIDSFRKAWLWWLLLGWSLFWMTKAAMDEEFGWFFLGVFPAMMCLFYIVHDTRKDS